MSGYDYDCKDEIVKSKNVTIYHSMESLSLALNILKIQI